MPGTVARLPKLNPRSLGERTIKESISGTLYRTRLPAVPARGDEAVPQGRALLHGEVRDREAQLPAGPARQAARGRRSLGYGLQLREKQKVKRIYGVLEDQFRRYFERGRAARGITGENLLQLLERRLDNVVYRLGFATSRAAGAPARAPRPLQVNGNKVNIPSYQVQGRADGRGQGGQPQERR